MSKNQATTSSISTPQLEHSTQPETPDLNFADLLGHVAYGMQELASLIRREGDRLEDRYSDICEGDLSSIDACNQLGDLSDQTFAAKLESVKVHMANWRKAAGERLKGGAQCNPQ